MVTVGNLGNLNPVQTASCKRHQYGCVAITSPDGNINPDELMKDFCDELLKLGQMGKSLVNRKKEKPYVSADYSDMIYNEKQRLKNSPLKQDWNKIKDDSKVNKDGILFVNGIKYTGVIELNDNKIVEYDQGLPITIVSKTETGERDKTTYVTEITKIKYPQDSVAPHVSTFSIVHQPRLYDHSSSKTVPDTIIDKTGIDLIE